MKRRILVSFSAGESSALMAVKMKKWAQLQDVELLFIFSNTGDEDERSLIFADRVDRAFDLNLVWVEAVVRHNERASCGHRVVNFETATRGSILFKEMARKYGIPNKNYPHCTRSLKLDPIKSYCREIGWEHGTYDVAIGIRNDEIDRMSVNAKKNKIIYPLISIFPSRKPQVNAFWEKQDFRLELKGYEGNCSWCWKKTLRKHLTIISERPEVYETPRLLEKMGGTEGSRGIIKPRALFRERRTVDDLFELAKKPFVPFHDENRVYELDLDTSDGCEDSCEAFDDYALAGDDR